MAKNKLVALAISVICFFAFFEGFTNPAEYGPIFQVVSLVGLIVGTVTALFIGNNEKSNSHNHH